MASARILETVLILVHQCGLAGKRILASTVTQRLRILAHGFWGRNVQATAGRKVTKDRKEMKHPPRAGSGWPRAQRAEEPGWPVPTPSHASSRQPRTALAGS